MVRDYYSEGGASRGHMYIGRTGELQPPCSPFTREYMPEGDDFEDALILANQEGLRSVALSVAETALAEMTPAPRSDKRVEAERYIQEHCANCVVNNAVLHPNGCPPNAELRALQEVQEAERKMEMFGDGPVSVTLLRVHGIGMTMKEFETLIADEEAIAAALQKEFTIDELLGNLQNRRLDPFLVRNLPHELATRLTFAQGNPAPFETHEISFAKVPHKIVLTDVSNRSGYKGALPSESDYVKLVTKMFNLMEETDQNGIPMLLSPDMKGKSCTVERSFEGGHIAELRISGSKNRMYLGVFKEPIPAADSSDAPTYRVIILGCHGGDADTQQKFYDATGIASLRR